MRKKIVFCSDDGLYCFDTQKKCLRYEKIQEIRNGHYPNIKSVKHGVYPMTDLDYHHNEMFWIKPTETSGVAELSSIFDEDFKVNEWCCVVQYSGAEEFEVIKMSDCVESIDFFFKMIESYDKGDES